MLAGGTLAKGVRPPESEHDHLYETALWYDTVAQLYGYTIDQADEQPYELLNAMVEVAAMRNEVAEEKSGSAQVEVTGAERRPGR